MEASALGCPRCGAPARLDSIKCDYCGSQLQTVTCPSCFWMMFLGARFCAHCGAKAASPIQKHESGDCPRCKTRMTSNAIAGLILDECGGCGGIWLDAQFFKEICEDKEKQAALSGPGLPEPAIPSKDPTARGISYLPCPRCGDLMNRVNFAGRSGIIINVCKSHGTWFDRDDLRGTIEFIRAGGLEAARSDELKDLAEQKKRIQAELETAAASVAVDLRMSTGGDQAFAGRLLRFLIKL